ncbi:MAG: hypothetical protein ACTSR8_06635 [Promethearchaeota archaeon]
MDIKSIIENVRNFIAQNDELTSIYTKQENLEAYFKSIHINVDLDCYKDIILQEETALELGGVDKKSFSLIYPHHILDFIKNGHITLIGPELKSVREESIDFGLLLFIGFKKINKKEFDNLRHFSFISNGIQGFMIRTIPRRFWCRISSEVRDKFSFELLGNAIFFLYKQKFQDLIDSMEIIFISSRPELIEELITITSEIREHLSSKWQEKIEEWKKRIDCEYDWECNECPYYDTCEDIKEVLEERTKLSD